MPTPTAQPDLDDAGLNYRQLFHDNPVPMWVYDVETLRFLAVNEAAIVQYGFSRDEFLAMTIEEIRPPEALEDFRQLLLSAANLKRRETVHRRKNGQQLPVEITSHATTHRGRPARLVLVNDVTERKALETQLHRFHRTESVGRLANGIAHDMNNILAPIIMGAPLLRSGSLAPDAQKILDAIESSAQRGAALVRQLLIFSRGIEGTRKTVHPRDVATEVAKICRQTFPRAIALELQLPDSLAAVHADPTQIEQVLLNLAVNARDAMPAGGRLTISGENTTVDAAYAALHKDAQPGRYVVLRVTDTGVGIPPEIAERIFDPFFTTKEVGKGTGLGLSSALGIVQAHGGFIRLHSEHGRGTTFAVYLPASDAAAPRPAPPRDTTATLHGDGELVMIVDDEDGVRGMVRDILVRYNYRVITAEDGVQATAVFAANPGVKLIVTDVDMPHMDGLNLVRVLQRIDPAARFVISTGLADPSGVDKRAAELAALGIKHVLSKPYKPTQLLTQVHAALHAVA